MTRTIGLSALSLAGTLAAAGAQDRTMSFFVTSANPGKGGDLGGLEGADAWCASLAEAAGVSGKTWRAYLSTWAENARDRIGPGLGSTPRARDRRERRRAARRYAAGLTKETALDEKGNVINGRGDSPNRHDILTGSLPDGTASPDTCGDWTMAARRARPWSATTTARASTIRRRRSRGTPRTPRAAAAASRRCAAPAATGSSTASPPTDAGSSAVVPRAPASSGARAAAWKRHK